MEKKHIIPLGAIAPQIWSGRCVSDGDVATIKGFECLFVNILRVLTTIAGLAFGTMLIIGGFKLIFSAGNPKETQAAQSTITHAITGLVAVIASWFILKFIENFTGLKVTEFKIPEAPSGITF